jgi:hypothetical protein
MWRHRKQSLRILILVYVVGTTWQGSGARVRQSPNSASQVAAGVGAPPSGKHIEFKVIMRGEIKDEDGVHFAVTSYQASDGVGLTLIQNEFASAVAARQYFDKVRGKATKIVTEGKKRDKAQKIVGERAEAIVSVEQRNETLRSIFWTFGSHFYKLESKSGSFRDCRELEKVLSE